MKVSCPECRKGFQIPADRLQKGKKFAFNCPACKQGRIEIDLRAKAIPAAQTAAASEAGLAKEKLSGEALKKRIMLSIRDLPPMPQVVLKAREVMADPNAGVKELAQVLETDQSVVTKVLRLSNSAYYGMSGKITTVQHAAVVLGEKNLGEIITLAGTSGLLGRNLKGYDMASGDLWRHSMAVAVGAKAIAQRNDDALGEVAMVAGIVHDAGKIILDPYIEERQDQFQDFLSDGQKTFIEAEKHILGFDHAQIATEICKRWQIPDTLTVPISYHHAPSQSGNNQMAYMLHMADYIATMSGIGIGLDDVLYKMDNGTMDALQLDQEQVSELTLEVMEAVEKMEAFQQV
jgi:HD-like signal output (HDOD) protein